MNVKTSGKRFSQINTQKLCNTEEIEEALISFLGRKESGNFNDWRQSLDNHSVMAKNFLKSKGLPSTQYICKINDGDEWIEKTPDLDYSLIRKNWSLTSYIKERYERDSKEDLCARLIDSIELLRWAFDNKSLFPAVSYAIEFSKVATLWKVYFIESRDNALGGSANKQKKWAIDYAKKLKHKYEGLKFKEIWLNIPTYEEDHFDMKYCSIYTQEENDCDYICADFGEQHIEKIKMDSFRTGYFISKRKR